MPIIERSIVINAPAEKIFAVEDDPTRLPEYLPGLVRIADYQQTPERIGESARYTYAVLGLRFTGKGTLLEREENKRIVTKIEGGIGGTQTTEYESQGNSTKVTWRLDYTMKGGILGKAANSLLVERMNEKTLRGVWKT